MNNWPIFAAGCAVFFIVLTGLIMYGMAQFRSLERNDINK